MGHEGTRRDPVCSPITYLLVRLGVLHGGQQVRQHVLPVGSAVSDTQTWRGRTGTLLTGRHWSGVGRLPTQLMIHTPVAHNCKGACSDAHIHAGMTVWLRLLVENHIISGPRLEFWPFFGPFRVQKIIFSFRKIFSQYSVPYRTRSPWNSEHSTSSTVPHRITHRQTHGVTTKAYSFNDVKYTVFSIYLIRNHKHIANITYSPSIIYSLGPETKLGIPTLLGTKA